MFTRSPARKRQDLYLLRIDWLQTRRKLGRLVLKTCMYSHGTVHTGLMKTVNKYSGDGQRQLVRTFTVYCFITQTSQNARRQSLTQLKFLDTTKIDAIDKVQSYLLKLTR